MLAVRRHSGDFKTVVAVKKSLVHERGAVRRRGSGMGLAMKALALGFIPLGIVSTLASPSDPEGLLPRLLPQGRVAPHRHGVTLELGECCAQILPLTYSKTAGTVRSRRIVSQ